LPAGAPLYTARNARRDATRWTLVQGLLAPLQFAVFLASLALVLRFLADRRRRAGGGALGLVKT
jgi:3-vinyl bacteriochlorophyllide hydratase